VDHPPAVATGEGGEEPEHVKYEGDHEPRLWPGRAGRSITWLADDVLGEAQDFHRLR
jgi:hypothetical protein